MKTRWSGQSKLRGSTSIYLSSKGMIPDPIPRLLDPGSRMISTELYGCPSIFIDVYQLLTHFCWLHMIWNDFTWFWIILHDFKCIFLSRGGSAPSQLIGIGPHQAWIYQAIAGNMILHPQIHYYVASNTAVDQRIHHHVTSNMMIDPGIHHYHHVLDTW